MSTRQSSPRKKRTTSYLLAHPAPVFGAQIPLLQKLRPRLSLQLQKLSEHERPRPVVDVYAAQAAPGHHYHHHGHHHQRGACADRTPYEVLPHDVLLMRSEDHRTGERRRRGGRAHMHDYLSSDDEEEEDVDELDLEHEPYGDARDHEEVETDDDSIEKKSRNHHHQHHHDRHDDLVAVLRPHNDGTAEIVVDGNAWTAVADHARGFYEFTRTDPATGHTTTARWVRRLGGSVARKQSSPLLTASAYTPSRLSSSDRDGRSSLSVSKRRSESALALSSSTSSSSAASSAAGISGRDARFTFSLIDRSSRRHPVLATLQQDRLEMKSHYSPVVSIDAAHHQQQQPVLLEEEPSVPSPTMPGSIPPVPETPTADSDSGRSDKTAVASPQPQQLDPALRTERVDDATRKLICVTGIWVALQLDAWSQQQQQQAQQQAQQAHLHPQRAASSAAAAPAAVGSKRDSQIRKQQHQEQEEHQKERKEKKKQNPEGVERSRSFCGSNKGSGSGNGKPSSSDPERRDDGSNGKGEFWRTAKRRISRYWTGCLAEGGGSSGGGGGKDAKRERE